MKPQIGHINAIKTQMNKTAHKAGGRHMDKSADNPSDNPSAPKLLSPMNAQGMRWTLLTPFAAFITFGLFVLMMVLISEEFKPQDKFTTGRFEINPKVEDVAPPDDRMTIEPYKLVTAPPPPPKIDRAVTHAPSVDIVERRGRIPDFEPPVIDPSNFIIQVSDRDPQPLVRIPPAMPLKATKSGHCRVVFDVNPQGQPFNVSATYCTEKLFESATIKSVQKWQYNPKILNGRAVSRAGVENKVSYRLTDGRGQVIPE